MADEDVFALPGVSSPKALIDCKVVAVGTETTWTE
jgi:hypothetical protein